MILKGLDGINHEVHIMDNAQDLNLFKWTQKNQFSYHTLKSNVGFGRGHNAIFRKTYKKDTKNIERKANLYKKDRIIQKIYTKKQI